MPHAAVNCVLRQPVLAGEPTQRSATRKGFLKSAGVGTVMRVAETDPQPHFDADASRKTGLVPALSNLLQQVNIADAVLLANTRFRVAYPEALIS